MAYIITDECISCGACPLFPGAPKHRPEFCPMLKTERYLQHQWYLKMPVPPECGPLIKCFLTGREKAETLRCLQVLTMEKVSGKSSTEMSEIFL